MRKADQAFRNASASYYYDRWKTLVESVINRSLSIVLIQRFGLYSRIIVVDCVVAYKVTSLLPKVVGVALYRSAPLRYHIGCCFNDT